MVPDLPQSNPDEPHLSVVPVMVGQLPSDLSHVNTTAEVILDFYMYNQYNTRLLAGIHD